MNFYKSKFFRSLAIFALFCLRWTNLVSADTQPSTLIYRTLGERTLQLAVHYPADWKSKDHRTAIIFFSGSHKVQPDRNGKLPPLAAERAAQGLPVINRGPGGEHHVPLCDEFARLGYVCFRVEYRTRGKDGVLPGEDIIDAISALRWVRHHAHELGISPDRIVAAGGSSGAYLAASIFAFEKETRDADLPQISARPNALLLYSPLVDWIEVGSMTESFLVVLNGDKELGERISPARHWRSDCPPTLIMVGTEEPPFEVVKRFAETWQAKGATIELSIADGEEHGFFGKKDNLEKTLDTTQQFLTKHQLSSSVATKPSSPDVGPPPAKESKNRNKQSDASTEERLQGMLKRFPEADANGDGKLTMEEAAAHRNKTKGGAQSPVNKSAEPKKMPSTLQSDRPSVPSEERRNDSSNSSLVPSRDWDTNQDGKLSKEEFKAPLQLFANLDLNADGFLDASEMRKLDSKLNLEKTSDVSWVVPPDTSFHGVSHHTYRSQAMNTDVGYNIYLPDDYSNSNIRYPVIYHLHGSGGNESVQIDQSAVYHQAISQSKMPPVIIVFVNGGRRSYYSDSADGKVLAETTIIRELIPHIDATYRTRSDRSNRVIEGFSMGGFGACKLAMKFPELFGVCLSFSGGIPGKNSVHQSLLDRILNGDAEQIRDNNPADLAAKNKDKFAEMPIWLFAGSRDVALEDSQSGDKLLSELGIEHRFEISPETGHALKRHFEYYGDEIFSLLSKQFHQAEQIDRKPIEVENHLESMLDELQSPNESVRLVAAKRLLSMGDQAKPAYPRLTKLLIDDEAIDVAIAAETIYATPRSLADLTSFIDGLQLDTKGRVPSAWALSQIGLPAGGQATDALLQALKHTDKHERNFVTIALAMVANPTSNLSSDFIKILQDPGTRETPQLNYKYPRAAAALAIGLATDGDRTAISALIDILERTSDWEYQRAAACFALGQIGSEEAASALEHAASDSSAIVRWYASSALRALKASHVNSKSVEEWIEQLEQNPNRVDQKMLDGLTRLGSNIQNIDIGNRKGSRRQALSAHESIALAIGFDESKSGAIDPKQILADQSKSLSNGSSQSYIAALGGVQQSITPTLLAALSQSQSDPRAQAIRQLGTSGKQAIAAIPALKKALNDRDWIVRREAFFALQKISP